jgi:pimeloyl-ACP methyl ester carboxylesterase
VGRHGGGSDAPARIAAAALVVPAGFGTALRTGDLAAEFPGPDDPGALAAFGAPTLAVTAEHDPFFPGTRTCKRVARTLPSLEDCVLLTGERHFLSPAGQDRATERIRRFLAEHGADSQ